jgi:hypothetical protein
MSARLLNARFHRLEKTTVPEDADTFTLVALCRRMWLHDRDHCIRISEEPGEWVFRSFIPFFHREDAERLAKRQGAR